MNAPVARIRNLDFRYDAHSPVVLHNVDLTLHKGQRHLLVGANGSGKTTILRILAGKHIVSRTAVEVLGRPAFHDTSLSRNVQLSGGVFACHVDITVEEMLAHRPSADPERKRRLCETLNIDLRWHMHRVSDGQRRRVQLLLDLLEPHELLLLDEVTTDLDVVVRADLLRFLKAESLQNGTCVFYATHVFDGLEEWATHLTALEAGQVRRSLRLADLEELAACKHRPLSSPLYRLVEQWLRHGIPPRQTHGQTID
jgi:CCR4-NOT complex subunit CAF16